MNDELFNPKPEKEPRIGKEAGSEKATAPKGSNRLSTIFLVVLAMHVIVIIGIVGFQLLRGKAKSDVVAAESQEQTAEVAKTEEASMQPTVETTTPTVAADQTLVTPENAASIPSVSSTVEPAWGNGTAQTTVETVAPAKPTVIAEIPKPTTSTKVTPATAGGTYTVVSGDTLTKIAKKNGISVKQLRESNALKNDVLKIGQKLTLPAGKAVAKTAEATSAKKVASAAPATSNGNFSLYTVEKGDTLNKIARSFNTTAGKIADLNKIADPTKIKIGMKLKLPVQATASSATTTSEAAATPASEPAAPATQFRAPQSADLAMLREGERK